MPWPFDNAVAAYEQGDYATALRLYRRLADQGKPDAQYNLGVMYTKGQGVPQNHAEAVKWYRRAADQGFARAQYNLGLMYANGQGLTQDDVQAVKWYRLAANQGDADAQVNLGRLRGEGLIMDEEDKVQHAPTEEAFGGYGLSSHRTFEFEVSDLQIGRSWDRKPSITDRPLWAPEFISSISGKAVSEDHVRVIGRDGSVKDFDFSLQVDTNAKETWESINGIYSFLANIDSPKNKPEYIGLMKHISERLDENPPTAALGNSEADWELGIKASWYISCQVPPEIFSKIEYEILANTVKSISIGVRWEAGLLFDIHAPPSFPNIWGLFCLNGSPHTLHGHVSYIAFSPTNFVKTKPKEPRDDMPPPPPPAPVAAVAPVVFTVPKSAIAALWVIALATALYLFK